MAAHDSIDRMPIRDYFDLPAINWTTLKEMRRSPMHYKYRLTHPLEDVPTFIKGRAAHTAILEPDRFLLDYVLFKGKRRAGKEYEALCEAHPEETILKTEEYETALAIRDAVRSHPEASKYLAKGRPEVCGTWTDEETGLLCKARFDWLCDAPGLASDVEVKTTTDLEAFERVCARFGYHCQVALQLRGLRALGRPVPAVIIAVELRPPHDVEVFRVEGDALSMGDADVGELLRAVKECRERDEWPGRNRESRELRLPAWVYSEAETTEGLGLVIEGQEV